LSATASHGQIVETAPSASFTWRTEDDTATFARRLAALPALRDAFIELQGDLGAGKTTFVRHLLRALGVQGRIKSPTYAVVEPHATPDGLAVSHFDFYRFNDPREWEDAGFRDLFAAPGLKLAEWPDKAAGLLPVPDLTLHIDWLAQDDQRAVRAQAGTARGALLLQGLREVSP
jgi:tRNA threonylcarbamoyladenosine biosynthesis protein TsaE